MSARTGIILGLLICAGLTTLWAGQAPAQSGESAAEQAQQNAAAIVGNIGQNMKAQMGYTYQQRIQMAYKGEVKDTILNQISFDASGKPSVMELSDSAAEGKHGRLGHRVRDAKEGEIKTDVKALTQLAKSYLAPNKEQLEALAKTGVVSYDGSDILLTATNWVQKGDKIVITADAKTMNRKSAVVTSASNDDPVSINATYSNLESGLNYLSEYVIDCPDEEVTLTVNTLNFEPVETTEN